MPLFLYHYTNPKGASGIENEQIIRVTPADSKFAWFGKGVYLTSISPTRGWRAILWNNHRKHDTKDMNLKAKTSVYFKFEASDLPSVKKMTVKDGRDVYLYPQHIDLDVVPYVTGFTNDVCVEQANDVESSSESETDEEYSSESETEDETTSESETDDESEYESETDDETSSESETDDETSSESETDDETDYDSEEEEPENGNEQENLNSAIDALTVLIEEANISETVFADFYANGNYYYNSGSYDYSDDDCSDYYD